MPKTLNELKEEFIALNLRNIHYTQIGFPKVKELIEQYEQTLASPPSNKPHTKQDLYQANKNLLDLYNVMTKRKNDTSEKQLQYAVYVHKGLLAFQAAKDNANQSDIYFLNRRLSNFRSHHRDNLTFFNKWAFKEQRYQDHISINKTLCLLCESNNSVELPQYYHNISNSYFEIYKQKTIFSELKQAYEYAKKAHKEDPKNIDHHGWYVVVSEAYASAISKTNPAKAISYYLETIKEFKLLEKNSSQQIPAFIRQTLFFSHNNLSYAHTKLTSTSSDSDLTNLEQAAKHAEQAQQYLKTLDKAFQKGHHEEAKNRFCQTTFAYAKALNAYSPMYAQKAVEILLALAEINKNDTHIAALIYNKIGSIYFHQEKYNEAIQYFEKALGIESQIKSGNEITHHMRHQLSTSYHMKACGLFKDPNAIEQTSSCYDRMIHLSEENGEIRKMAVGLFGKASLMQHHKFSNTARIAALMSRAVIYLIADFDSKIEEENRTILKQLEHDKPELMQSYYDPKNQSFEEQIKTLRVLYEEITDRGAAIHRRKRKHEQLENPTDEMEKRQRISH